jgi:hypothetical protein
MTDAHRGRATVASRADDQKPGTSAYDLLPVFPTMPVAAAHAPRGRFAGLPLDPSFAGGAEARRFNRLLINADLIKGL